MGHAGQIEVHVRRTELACAQLGELAFENQAGLGRLVGPYPQAVDLELTVTPSSSLASRQKPVALSLSRRFTPIRRWLRLRIT